MPMPATTHTVRLAVATLCTLAAGLATLPAQALTLGQSDTFEDGSTQGWQAGPAHPLPPSVVASGGPAGAGDHYLRLQAIGGAGPASRLAAENIAQWTGNYTAAGVTALTLDAANFGSTELWLRLLFDGSDGTNFARAWSAVPVVLPAGSGWQTLRFEISPADLQVQGGGNVALALSDTYSIRLFHSTASTFPGGTVVATLGVDNITAVPEPAAAWLLALGLVGLALHRRRGAPTA